MQRFHSNLLTKAFIVTTPPDKPALSADELANLIKEYVLGQDAAVDAFAAQFIQRRNTHPADRPLGVFLLAGPDPEGRGKIVDALLSATHATACYGDFSNPLVDEDAPFSLHTPANSRGSIATLYKAYPSSMAHFDNIDKASPTMLSRLQVAWRTGLLPTTQGQGVSIAGATFLLSTDLAGEAIDHLMHRESDPDRLHIESLKILLDAGFPASLLSGIDRVVCLRSVTIGERTRGLHQALAELVADYGLELEEGGIDARILIEPLAPPVGMYADGQELTEEMVQTVLLAAKAQGMTRVRLIQGETGVIVVPATTPVTGA